MARIPGDVDSMTSTPNERFAGDDLLQTATPSGSLTGDDLLRVIGHRRRRATIEALASAGPLSTDQLIQHVTESGDDETDVAVSLHHVHLPKLDDSGVIERDGEVRLTALGNRVAVALNDATLD